MGRVASLRKEGKSPGIEDYFLVMQSQMERNYALSNGHVDRNVRKITFFLGFVLCNFNRSIGLL